MLKLAIRDRARDERGLVVVWLAIMMVVLLGIAALVLDLGHARETKREVQNAADAAALGAAQDLPVRSAADAEAKSLAATNLSGIVPQWSGCQDSARLATFSSTSCISFDSSFTRVRVHVPDSQVDTSFAKILGIDTIGVRAAAEAQIVSAGLGTIQPFALYSSGSYGRIAWPWQGAPSVLQARRTRSPRDYPRTRAVRCSFLASWYAFFSCASTVGSISFANAFVSTFRSRSISAFSRAIASSWAVIWAAT
jgi:hypothetical protein